MKHATHDIIISTTKASKDYELLDSGDGEKLERFGAVVFSRPDPQEVWPRRLSADEWEKADGRFVRSAEEGKWVMKNTLATKDASGKSEKSWPVEFDGLKFLIKPTAFKH